MNAVVDDLTNYLGPDPNADGDGGFTKVYQVTAGQTWTLSPTMLMDMTFGFSRQKQEVLGPDFNAGNFGLDVLGIPGHERPGHRRPALRRVSRSSTPASARVGNRDGWNPIFRDERTYSLATNLTKLKGRHDIRGGYFVNFMYLDHWQPETGNPRGSFTFIGNTTGLRGGQTTNFYNQYASFLLGLVGNVNKSVQNELMTAREWQHALYFRDRWNVNSKLTLDLGLRWEFYPIMHARRRPRHRPPRSDEPDSTEARRPHRRPRRQPADQRDGGRPGQLRAARRRASTASTTRRSSAPATA